MPRAPPPCGRHARPRCTASTCRHSRAGCRALDSRARPVGRVGFVFRVVFSAAPKGDAAPCFRFKMKTLFSLSF